MWSTGARHAGFSGCCTRAQSPWRVGSATPWHVESCKTRAQACVPCTGRWIPTRHPTGEAPLAVLTVVTGLFFFGQTRFICQFVFSKSSVFVFLLFFFLCFINFHSTFFFFNSWRSQETTVPAIPGNSTHRERGEVRGQPSGRSPTAGLKVPASLLSSVSPAGM